VIEPSVMPYYNSPVFMVLKKNMTKRLVVDLRGINSWIIPKLVQLPQIEELLETVTVKNHDICRRSILRARYGKFLLPKGHMTSLPSQDQTSHASISLLAM